MKILIPNATSPKNIGDQAILSGLLSVVRNKSSLKIQSTNYLLNKNIFLHDFSPTLYSWAVFENRNAFVRVKRVLQLLYSYLTFKYFKKTFLISKALDSLLEDYKNADVILFVGGGYLRSQKGITQTLNLLMILLLFQFAKLTKAKKIIAPISFGPFAYKWQEKYAAKIIKNFNLVMAREQYSYDLLKKHKIKNLTLSSDTSFLLELKNKSKTDTTNMVLGFTIRKWLKDNLQTRFEKEFTQSIVSFSKSTGAIIQPIIQVDAPEYGDFDASLTEKIAKNLKIEGVKVNPTKKVTDLEKSVEIYSKIDLLLGMRMHSNILAAIQGTPFVAISYEHKTEGIAKDLGVSEYVIKAEGVTEEKLYKLIMKAYKNTINLKNTINTSVKKKRVEESKAWDNVFQNYL